MTVTEYTLKTLTARYGDDITIHGCGVNVHGGVLSSAFHGIHPHDVSQVLDQSNVSSTPGTTARSRLMRILGAAATAAARASISTMTRPTPTPSPTPSRRASGRLRL